MENESKQLKERIFKIKMADKESYSDQNADLAAELGKFDEAINLYLKDIKNTSSNYQINNSLRRALNVAKEHVPERVKEIAILGFKAYNKKHDDSVLYLESARILDKEKEAEKLLRRESEKANLSSSCAGGLVTALVSLGLHNEARSVAQKTEAYEMKQAQSGNHEKHNLRYLADIFLTLGDKEKAVKALLYKIDLELLNNCDKSYFLEDINKVYSLTGDPTILQKKILVFEREREYNKAADLARELGRADLAEMYNSMQDMVLAAVKGAKVLDKQ